MLEYAAHPEPAEACHPETPTDRKPTPFIPLPSPKKGWRESDPNFLSIFVNPLTKILHFVQDD